MGLGGRNDVLTLESWRFRSCELLLSLHLNCPVQLCLPVNLGLQD